MKYGVPGSNLIVKIVPNSLFGEPTRDWLVVIGGDNLVDMPLKTFPTKRAANQFVQTFIYGSGRDESSSGMERNCGR